MARKNSQALVSAVQQCLFAQEIPTVELTYRAKRTISDLPKVCSVEEVYTFARQNWDPLKINLCEEFKVCLLNHANRILGVFQLSSGGIAATYVDPRHVICAALLANATSIILMHNHPSGDFRPSGADQELTQKIKAAAKNLDIKVHDHIIITDNSYYSFAEHGIL